jgi:hypothetical protein
MSQVDHGAYKKKVKKMTEAELRYTIKDAQGAIEALPDNEKNGYYADEINYCAEELYRRGLSESPS